MTLSNQRQLLEEQEIVKIIKTYEQAGAGVFLKQKQSYSKHEVLKLIKMFDEKVKVHADKEQKTRKQTE